MRDMCRITFSSMPGGRVSASIFRNEPVFVLSIDDVLNFLLVGRHFDWCPI